MADKTFFSKEIPLTGKLVTSVDPATIDTNFQTLKNLRYTDTGLRAIQGMSKINSTAITTYTNLKHGFHLNNSQPAESHVLVQAYNSGETASQVHDNKTAIPNTGDFEATALHTDASGASHGHFSGAPNGMAAYCNSKESMIWGGDELFTAGFLNEIDTSTPYYRDFTTAINNTKTDSNNIATLTSIGGDRCYIYVGSILPLKGVKFYIGTANTDAVALKAFYWDGSAWQAVSNPSDGTVSGGVTLAQTGSFTFDSTDSIAKIKNINSTFLYWYKFQSDDGAGGADLVDNTTTVTQCTVDAPFQSIKDIWGGENSLLLTGLLKVATDRHQKYTVNWFAEDHSATGATTNASTGKDLTAMAVTTTIRLGFEERLTGINVVIQSGGNTTNSAMTVAYWDGDSFVSVGTIEDGTSPASATMLQSGTVTWTPPATSAEFKTSFDNSPPLYFYELSVDVQFAAVTILVDSFSGIPTQKEIGNYAFPLFAHDRLFLCSDQDGRKNSVIVSALDTSTVFNGLDSTELTFGDDRAITAGAGLYRQYGSTLYNITVFTKNNETWILVGNDPENWVQYRASGTVGCPAPHTMITANVGFEAVPTQNRYVAIWQGLEGIYLFDGNVISDISKDISDLFDKRNSSSINTSKIGESFSFFDYEHQEYHWVFASGSSTSADKEMVYDLVRKKWYEVSRGSGKILQMGVEVADTDGNRYNYGGANDGFLYRLDNGTTFDGNNIVANFRFGDMALGGQEGGSINVLTRLRKIKLITTTKTSTSNSIAITYRGDGVSTGTSLTSISPIKSGSRITQVVTGTNQGRFTFHNLDFSMTTNDESIPFEPLFVGLLYTEEGLDLN